MPRRLDLIIHAWPDCRVWREDKGHESNRRQGFRDFSPPIADRKWRPFSRGFCSQNDLCSKKIRNRNTCRVAALFLQRHASDQIGNARIRRKIWIFCKAARLVRSTQSRLSKSPTRRREVKMNSASGGKVFDGLAQCAGNDWSCVKLHCSVSKRFWVSPRFGDGMDGGSRLVY